MCVVSRRANANWNVLCFYVVHSKFYIIITKALESLKTLLPC